MRILTDAEKAALDAPRKRIAYLVMIDVIDDPLYLCTARYDLDVGGITWLGRGRLLELLLPREDSSLAANKATLRLSGLTPAMISLGLNEDIEGEICSIFLATFNPDTRAALGFHLHSRRVIGQVRINPPTSATRNA